MPQRSVTFKYKFPDTFNHQYANGAHAASTPAGELAITFYVERLPVPHSTTQAIDVSGNLGEVVAKDPPDEENAVLAIRFVTSGVILTIDSAKKIHQLLGEQIAFVEQAITQAKAAKAKQQ